MQEDNETKVYARANFDLNKVRPPQSNAGTRIQPETQQAAEPSNQQPESPPSIGQSKSQSDQNEGKSSDPSKSANHQNAEDSENSLSASPSRQLKRKKTQQQRLQTHLSDHIVGTTKSGFGQPAGAVLSREERKNRDLMRMIERQEKLLKRREQKKLISVAKSEDHSQDERSQQQRSGDRQSANGRRVQAGASTREGKKQARGQQFSALSGKGHAAKSAKNNAVNKSDYEITVVFQDAGTHPRSNNMSRYFQERKSFYEERSRQQDNYPTQEQYNMWANQGDQYQGMLMHQYQTMLQKRGYYPGGMPYHFNHVPAGTGGNDSLGNEECSISSSFSSMSKRQRVDNYRGMIAMTNPYHHFWIQHGPTAANGYISQSVQPRANQAFEGGEAKPQCVSEEQASVDNIDIGQNAEANKQAAVALADQCSDEGGAGDSQEEMQKILELTRQFQKRRKPVTFEQPKSPAI